MGPTPDTPNTPPQLTQLRAFVFPKAERLCSTKAIDNLFRTGTSFTLWGIRFVYKLLPAEQNTPPIQVLFTVPKRKHRRANVRNTLKRRMREAYRQHRNPLKQALIGRLASLHLAIIYERTKVSEYRGIARQIADGLAQLERQVAASPVADVAPGSKTETGS